MASRPTSALINLGNLAFNIRSIRDFIGTETSVMAVVKADAYGHGAVACAQRLEDEGVEWFAVALPEEGIELRKAGISRPILCLGGFWSGQADLMIANALTPVILDLASASELDQAARNIGKVVPIHVKIDTGMGRLGIRPEGVLEFAAKLKDLGSLRVDGLLTHFSVADDMHQTEYTGMQCRRFDEAMEAFRSRGHEPTYTSLANSPGAVAHPGTRRSLVRLGGIVYGLGGDVLPEGMPAPELRAVMSLETRIAQVKDFPAGESLGYGRTAVTGRPSRIATLPIGYHDGLPRALSNIGTVLVRGARAPIVGRISMDWTLVDVTEIPEAVRGDKVTVIGRDSNDCITAEDLAKETGTISYEITCGIGSRVPRRYD